MPSKETSPGLSKSHLILGVLVIIFAAGTFYSTWNFFQKKKELASLQHVKVLSENGKLKITNTGKETFYIAGFSVLYWVDSTMVNGTVEKKLKFYEHQVAFPEEGVDKDILKQMNIHIAPTRSKNLKQDGVGQNIVDFPGEYVFFSITVLDKDLYPTNFTSYVTDQTKEEISINLK